MERRKPDRIHEAQTMFELVQYLTQGAETLHEAYRKNPISLDAGCQLFIAFVTLYPHESVVSGN